MEEAKTVPNPYRRKKEKTADDEIRILHEAYQFLLKRPVLVLLSKFYPDRICIYNQDKVKVKKLLYLNFTLILYRSLPRINFILIVLSSN